MHPLQGTFCRLPHKMLCILNCQKLCIVNYRLQKVRKKSAFVKNYIEGKYGAVPYFEIDEKLNQLLYKEAG